MLVSGVEFDTDADTDTDTGVGVGWMTTNQADLIKNGRSCWSLEPFLALAGKLSSQLEIHWEWE
jgi:hypothetical protein